MFETICDHDSRCDNKTSTLRVIKQARHIQLLGEENICQIQA
jgi:hypothetical protein